MTLKIKFTKVDEKKAIEQNQPRKDLFYEPQGNEVRDFEASYKRGRSIALIGPTGSGKSRFFEYMAAKHERPYILVAGEESTDAGTVIGSPYIEGDSTVFIPGPLYVGTKIGAFTALEEVLEMKNDVLPFLHPLTDKRRRLVVNDLNEIIEPPKGFMFAVMFNPGLAYQSASKRWPKPSFIQRYSVIRLNHIRGEKGTNIISQESGLDIKIAKGLDKLAQQIDKLHESRAFPHMQESVGYHALIKAAEKIADGIPIKDACHIDISSVLSDDTQVVKTVDDLVKTIFG